MDLDASDNVQESKSVPLLDAAEHDQSAPGPNSRFMAVSSSSFRRNPGFFEAIAKRSRSDRTSGSNFSLITLLSALQLLERINSCRTENDAILKDFIVVA